MASFENFISQRYPGLNFLSVSLGINIPGVILNNDDRVIDGLSHLFPDRPSNSWTTKEVKAGLGGESISGVRDLSVGLTVLGIFTLKGGVSSKYSVAFEFGEATALVFDTNNGGIFENDARKWIIDLKHQNKPRWKDCTSLLLWKVYMSTQFQSNSPGMGKFYQMWIFP